MGTWSRDRVDSSTLNRGNEYEKGDRVSREQLNAMVNSGLYAQDFAEALADAPDISGADNVGTPKVEIVANGNYKKFKFSNLKGVQGEQGKQGERGFSVLYSLVIRGGAESALLEEFKKGNIITWIPTQDLGLEDYRVNDIIVVSGTTTDTNKTFLGFAKITNIFSDVIHAESLGLIISGAQGEKGAKGDSVVSVDINSPIQVNEGTKYNLDVLLSSGVVESSTFIVPKGETGQRGSDGVGITNITSGNPIVSTNTTETPITFHFSNNSTSTINVSAKNGGNGLNGLTKSRQLWFASGDYDNSTGDKTLSEPYTNYDLIVIVWGSTGFGCYQTNVLHKDMIGLFSLSNNFGANFSGTSTQRSCYGHFSGETTFTVSNTNNAGLKAIIGIN